MLPTEQPKLFEVVQDALAAYTKSATAPELTAWWMTCRVFTLEDVHRALAAHQMDPDDGKRAPRPVDVKRRLVSGVQQQHQRREDPHFSERLARYNADKVRAPAVVNTAHAIALRHGDRPWQGTYKGVKDAGDLVP